MLTALSIRNIVLIDALDLDLRAGLTVLTGETGAGKSILLDALSLALGGRGSANLVRSGETQGQVSAAFELPSDHAVWGQLDESGVVGEGDLILRRVQFSDGRSKSFINDQPVSVGLLNRIGAQLIEIHGQHDDRALVDVSVHRGLLDAFGGSGSLVGKVAKAWEKFRASEQAMNDQRARIAKAAEDEDFLRHSVEELKKLNPSEGEEEELAATRQRLMQLEKVASDVNDAADILSGPHAPGPEMSGLMRRLLRKSDNAPGLFDGVVEALDKSLAALDMAQGALDDVQRQMDFDPGELEGSEERLFALRAAGRKYNVSADALPGLVVRFVEELNSIENGADQLAALEQQTDVDRGAYFVLAEKLSAARSKVALGLEKAVGAELPDLKLERAEFIVHMESGPERASAAGIDQINFWVRTNPGTNAGPMLKVASGGELSRFLLALKVVLADKGSAPVLIFDEIDTGVGGAVADAMGNRLARLSDKVQVLCVTHAPQVAARAGTHLLIAKAMNGAGMATDVRRLGENDRREEVARMLSGAQITDAARAAADQLLDGASA